MQTECQLHPAFRNPCRIKLQALENVHTAATALLGEGTNVRNARSGRLVRVRRGALRDLLGALAAPAEDVTAAELAVKVTLEVGRVALNRNALLGGNERGSNSDNSDESLEHFLRCEYGHALEDEYNAFYVIV